MNALKKLFSSDASKAGVSLHAADGVLVLSQREHEIYSQLFRVVDSNASGQVEGRDGALFLRLSGLPLEKLRDIWRIACGGTSKPALNLADWCVACRLVALCQNDPGVEVSMESLRAWKGIELADFGLGDEPNIEPPPTEVIAKRYLTDTYDFRFQGVRTCFLGWTAPSLFCDVSAMIIVCGILACSVSVFVILCV